MADRQLDLTVDVTPQTVPIDLVPGFRGMEQSFVELQAFRADKTTINFEITQNGVAFDLTNFTVKYQAKRAIGDTTPFFDKTGTVASPTSGKVTVVLDGSDLETDPLDEERLTTQLFLTQSGTTQTVLQIPLVVQPSV